MQKTCKFCQKPFEIAPEDEEFYARIDVPHPTLCPKDRNRRRASFRNERNLYHRKCDATGKEIISMYSPDKPFKVFDQEYFWGDTWDPRNYGRNFDFERPFFEQFRELQVATPRLSLFNYQSENSYYTNHAGKNKNCYMGVDLGSCEDVYMSNWVTYSKDCIDCSYTYHSELCYFCLYCEKCFNCDFCERCETCSDCSMCFDCKGCNNCFMCTGLRNKEFYILNEKVSKEEYEKIIESFRYSYEKQEEAWQKFSELKKSVPHKFAHIVHSENCTGDYIYNCKNTTQSFDVVNMWDCKYCYNALDTKDGYDLYQPGFEPCELIYEIHGGVGYNNCQFMTVAKNSSNCNYCDNVFDCQNCFGCVSMKKGRYCILNKQYSQEEYENLRAKIIEHMKKTGEWGEFFPFWCSPFGYNESKAQEYYPLTKEEVLQKGMNWCDHEVLPPTGEGISPPDDIREVDDSILEKVIIGEKSHKPFKIIKPELDFYRRKKLPTPRKHWQKRYEERMALRNPRHLWNRTCAKCNAPIQTTYSLERPETVYCEKCYLGTVY